MYNTEFNAWLQGFLSVANPENLTSRQLKIIQSHIELCAEVCNGSLTIVNSWIRDMDEDMREVKSLKALVDRDFQRKPIISGQELGYFIQGFFEISDEESPVLNQTQMKMFIYEIERNVDGLDPLILDFYWNLRQCITDKMDAFDTKKIKSDLNTLFQHVIDPSYGFTDERNAELQKIHDEYKSEQ